MFTFINATIIVFNFLHVLICWIDYGTDLFLLQLKRLAYENVLILARMLMPIFAVFFYSVQECFCQCGQICHLVLADIPLNSTMHFLQGLCALLHCPGSKPPALRQWTS